MDFNRLEEVILEQRNRYVLSFVGKERPANYNEVVAKYDEQLRDCYQKKLEHQRAQQAQTNA